MQNSSSGDQLIQPPFLELGVSRIVVRADLEDRRAAECATNSLAVLFQHLGYLGAAALCEADQVSSVEGDQVLKSTDRVEQLVVLWLLPGLDRFNDLGQRSHATYFSLLISSSWLGRL